MRNKGLCSSCVNEKDCCLTRNIPVLQCEEFSCYESVPTKPKKTEHEKKKSDEESTVGEFIGE